MRRISVVELAIALSAALLLPMGVTAAEKYPDRPIKIVVAWGAGSSQDIPQRIAAEEAKEKPDTVRWAMSVGNQSHFIPLNIEKQTGAKFIFVAVPGGDVQRQAALLAGNIDGLLGYPSSVAEYVKAGKFKLLGVSYAQRIKSHPDLPTFKEQGIDVVYEFRVGLTGPKGIPADRVKIINAAYEKALKDPATVKKLEDLGFDIDFMNAADLKSWFNKFAGELEAYAKEAYQK